MNYCTAKDYAVSITSGTGIEGVILNVHISGKFFEHVEGNGLKFISNEEADAYCLEKGYIQEYKREVA